MHISNINRLVCKRTSLYLENCRGNYSYNKGSLYAIFCQKRTKYKSLYFRFIKYQHSESYKIYTSTICTISIFKKLMGKLSVQCGYPFDSCPYSILTIWMTRFVRLKIRLIKIVDKQNYLSSFTCIAKSFYKFINSQ